MPIRLRSDYENANGRLVSAEPASVRFEAEARNGRWPLWFRFWLSGLPRDAEVELVLANASEVLGGLAGLQHVQPLLREAGQPWRRCAGAMLDAEAGEFHFACPTGPGEIEVAFCHPFSYSDLEAWLRDLPGEVGQSELAVSPGGLSVPLLRVGDARTARHGIWIAAASMRVRRLVRGRCRGC
ncbi:MAG TPA: hypothetical protein DEP45_00645 [Armatimonadetes bacterium]|nr:hypothetical protein [Armatimonadota bacterium]